MKKLGIYIHIPFCLKKCFYCDFYSEAESDYAARKRYVDALIKEIDHYSHRLNFGCPVDTVFVGGGTPSLLESDLVTKIMETLHRKFTIDPNGEITIESNPATLTDEKLAAYRDAGINRLSIGAQSFNDDLLRTMGRIHSSAEIGHTVEMARAAGFKNINLDLMFGIPGQTMDAWQDTVEKALRLRPEHLSFYSLELAENTPFYTMIKDGSLKETSAEEDRRMYHFLLERIGQAGYHQYEISNGAIEGYECRHNLAYWNMGDYLGLGPSAHSFMDGKRFFNVSDVDKYVGAVEDELWSEAVSSSEPNDFMDNVTDYVFTKLRLTEGIAHEDFEGRFGKEFWQVFKDRRCEFNEYITRHEAFDDGKQIKITEKGMDIANKIISLFL